MDSELDGFKQFVRKYPGLKHDVRNGKATWQSIYEEWYLYGEEDSQWEKYKSVPTETEISTPLATNINGETTTDADPKTTTANSTLNATEMMTQAFQYLQKMDMNKVQQTMGTVQKFIQIFQTFQGGSGGSAGAGLGAAASQRQSFPGLFSKFDD
ncbi:YlbD family protein [Turicibacter sp. TJ11]|uniref:YlbD family protein n=1 Tax=Turicibacter sp. TJ11 TaxID=2806443 RepID=UPI001F42C492|nr:YlbD family protein [Turicibacter sp. TJ11]